jgi:hypothetical protein
MSTPTRYSKTPPPPPGVQGHLQGSPGSSQQQQTPFPAPQTTVTAQSSQNPSQSHQQTPIRERRAVSPVMQPGSGGNAQPQGVNKTAQAGPSTAQVGPSSPQVRRKHAPSGVLNLDESFFDGSVPASANLRRILNEHSAKHKLDPSLTFTDVHNHLRNTQQSRRNDSPSSGSDGDFSRR